ncbi:MAG: transglutaminase family protein [Candidatus Hinthialibacter antarcticus]|nr:transglutaminase family protein [Candidatus Hinthialibacter antarcticus]
MIYSIRHVTQYMYDSPMTFGQNRATVEPRSSIMQKRLDFDLLIEPHPSELVAFTDFFGNTVHYFTINTPLSELKIQATSRVECFKRLAPEASLTPAWDTIQSIFQSRNTAEDYEAFQYQYESPFVPIDTVFRDYALPSFEPGRPILEGVLDLTARIHHDFEYQPFSTDITTSTYEVMEIRKGVCQDFAHLQIACLRSLGLPARYVSGYLRTSPPPGQERLQGSDASHAWLSVYIPDAGWIDVDPTNNILVSTDHITIAWGRDYDEVSPVKGTVFGGGNHSVNVSVDVIPE